MASKLERAEKYADEQEVWRKIDETCSQAWCRRTSAEPRLSGRTFGTC